MVFVLIELVFLRKYIFCENFFCGNLFMRFCQNPAKSAKINSRENFFLHSICWNYEYDYTNYIIKKIYLTHY